MGNQLNFLNETNTVNYYVTGHNVNTISNNFFHDVERTLLRTIPDVIKQCIGEYLNQLIPNYETEWDEKKKGDFMRVMGKTVLLEKGRIYYWGGKTEGYAQTIYGKMICTAGNTYRFKLKINNIEEGVNIHRFCIGVAGSNSNYRNQFATNHKDCSVFENCGNSGRCVWINGDNSESYNCMSRIYEYGQQLRNSSVIEVTLNLESKDIYGGILSFKINDVCYGNVTKYLRTDRKYCFIVSMWSTGTEVTML
eukprot:184076_1